MCLFQLYQKTVIIKSIIFSSFKGGDYLKYKKFEKLLKERNLSTYEVAKHTGICNSTFSDWKQGKYTPKTDKLLILANYFNVPIEYFIN